MNELHIFTEPEATVRRSSVKKVFLEISLNSQENACARVSAYYSVFWLVEKVMSDNV